MAKSKTVKKSAAKPAAKAEAKPRAKRGVRFRAFVRDQIASVLYRRQGIDPRIAERYAASVSDTELDAAADERKIGDVGDDGFITRLIAFLPQIRALIEFFVSLFAMFSAHDDEQAYELLARMSSDPDSRVARTVATVSHLIPVAAAHGVVLSGSVGPVGAHGETGPSGPAGALVADPEKERALKDRILKGYAIEDDKPEGFRTGTIEGMEPENGDVDTSKGEVEGGTPAGDPKF